MRRKKRDPMQIYYEVLKELSSEPMGITHIMRKCNLDTRLARHVIDVLKSRNLLKVRVTGGSRLYFITEKGAEYIRLYELLQSLLEKPELAVSGSNRSHYSSKRIQ